MNYSPKKSILFVCTGNVFRSMSAEKLFKKHLDTLGESDWVVSSAGIVAHPQDPHPYTLKTLHTCGVTSFSHKQQRLTKKHLESFDVVVAMAQNHVDCIKEQLDHSHVLLFNDLAFGKRTSIPDIEDVVLDYATNKAAVNRFVAKIVSYIAKHIPRVYEKANERFYLFSDFVSSKRTHRNGYPFISLYETPRTVAFMSIDIPQKEDGHILVIPKKRYADVCDVPKSTVKELMESIQHIGKTLKKNHGGFNILLNNGIAAGQYIFHTHAHLIPRNLDDDIQIEVWGKQNVSQKMFVNLNNSLKRQLRSAQR
jgi:diadenosine tetraphosphate (Ap4A) HIT family hydrolase/protein-tyrosine-phosphatase